MSLLGGISPLLKIRIEERKDNVPIVHLEPGAFPVPVSLGSDQSLLDSFLGGLHRIACHLADEDARIRAAARKKALEEEEREALEDGMRSSLRGQTGASFVEEDALVTHLPPAKLSAQAAFLKGNGDTVYRLFCCFLALATLKDKFPSVL